MSCFNLKDPFDREMSRQLDNYLDSISGFSGQIDRLHVEICEDNVDYEYRLSSIHVANDLVEDFTIDTIRVYTDEKVYYAEGEEFEILSEKLSLEMVQEEYENE